jgi:hypothetical protein
MGTEHSPADYVPESDFLRAFLADEIPLQGSEFADANLRLLIEATKSDVIVDRDWATMLLAGSDIVTPEVRAALIARLNDSHNVIRGEAILGMAQRDPDFAAPIILRELSGDIVCGPILEAAQLVAHPSFIDELREWAEPSDDPYIDKWAQDALDACLKARQGS